LQNRWHTLDVAQSNQKSKFLAFRSEQNSGRILA
jgi:hypothetical protein